MKGTRELFDQHQGNLIHKWDHYFEIYDRHFKDYQDKEVVVLEIGVSQGGSIDLWKKFFGSKLRYYGIDINPKCKELEAENVTIFIGSQSDVEFLTKVKTLIPELDILIDDGGHTMKQQIVSFENLYEKVKFGGLYLCEDNHTSYWFEFGGGMKKKGTYLEYVKNLIDVMHLWYAGKNANIPNKQLKESIYAIHIYNSIVVIEKEKIPKPFDKQIGNFTVGYMEDEKKTIGFSIRRFLFKLRHKIKFG